VILGFYALAASYPPSPRLLAFDAVAHPGEEVDLEVRVEQDLPPLLDLDAEAVEVTVEGAAIGKPPRARVAVNGTATFRVRAPAEESVHGLRVSARCTARGPRAWSLTSTANLHVIRRDRKLVLATVWDTLSRLPLVASRDGESGGHDRPRPKSRDHAKEVLAELARDRAVVYIEFRPSADLPRARDWLREEGFPPGAILFPRGVDPRNVDETKKPRLIHLLSEIRGRWPNIEQAIAFDEHDASTFAEARIPTIQVGSRGTLFPGDSRVRQAEGWEEVKSLLE
jgi:hypothetical protein